MPDNPLLSVVNTPPALSGGVFTGSRNYEAVRRVDRNYLNLTVIFSDEIVIASVLSLHSATIL